MKKTEELTIGEAKLRLQQCKEEYEELSLLFNKEVNLNEQESNMKGKYVIIRSYDSGVHAGTFVSDKHTLSGRLVILHNSRRIWYWDGAASLSELAVHGTSKPDKCKFPCEVKEIEVDRVCEVIPCTDKAENSIKSVKVWSNA